MNTKEDEHLEALWRMQEQEKDTLDDLQTVLGVPCDTQVIDSLVSGDMAAFRGDNKRIVLTEKGGAYARDLVRKHRLAERLLYDVLGVRSAHLETEACTFEHLVAPYVVDGICTLLGHPRECPHGLAIPPGPCCQRSENVITTSVMYLSQLDVGEAGQVAYVDCQDRTQLYRLRGLQVKPGAEIKLHQKYPAYVVECEGGMIAMDEWIAKHIIVWRKPSYTYPDARTDGQASEVKPKKRGFWQWMRR